MKIFDLNVCLYALNAESIRHSDAKETLEEALNEDEPVAFAWVVLLGFLRIATNPRILPKPLSPQQAFAVVDGWLGCSSAIILQPGPEHWRVLKELLEESGTAANLTTDAHLAALAIENGAKLISFDTDFARFKRLKWIQPKSSNR